MWTARSDGSQSGQKMQPVEDVRTTCKVLQKAVCTHPHLAELLHTHLSMHMGPQGDQQWLIVGAATTGFSSGLDMLVHEVCMQGVHAPLFSPFPTEVMYAVSDSAPATLELLEGCRLWGCEADWLTGMGTLGLSLSWCWPSVECRQLELPSAVMHNFFTQF